MAISEIDHSLIGTELYVPVVETEVFDARPDAVFWSGIIATGADAPVEGAYGHLANEFLAARQLRANVYIDEYGYLPESARQADGGESDAEDIRSTQFGIIHNDDGIAKMRGTSRLIHKTDDESPLPVESFFPDVFASDPAPVGSVEASRFISRHPNKMAQHTIMLGLVRAMVANAEREGSPFIYAVVEEHLASLFGKIGLLHDVIADPVYVKEYDSENMALRFNPADVLDQVDEDKYGNPIRQLFFGTTRQDGGLGHYDEGLITPLEGDK